ncbi:MAG TPA: hypothetical protein VGE45_21965 [Chloroflexia bacterium]|jgi:hypothetical protein
MLPKRHLASVLASMLILLLASQPAVGAYVVPYQPDPVSQYFPETKQNVNPPFIGHWQTHGGLAQQGYPISGELQLVSTDGKTYKTQFFERAVFEQHPEYAGTSNEVLLKLVGQTFYDRRFKDGPPKDQATNPDNTLTFKETGHAIGGRFRAYWEKHGGLAQQGYPMTDEFKMASTDGKEYTTQIFQRAVFELHPEFAGTENEVLLRLLGVEELEEANQAAATPEPTVSAPTATPEVSSATSTPETSQLGPEDSRIEFSNKNGVRTESIVNNSNRANVPKLVIDNGTLLEDNGEFGRRLIPSADNKSILKIMDNYFTSDKVPEGWHTFTYEVKNHPEIPILQGIYTLDSNKNLTIQFKNENTMPTILANEGARNFYGARLLFLQYRAKAGDGTDVIPLNKVPPLMGKDEKAIKIYHELGEDMSAYGYPKDIGSTSWPTLAKLQP